LKNGLRDLFGPLSLEILPGSEAAKHQETLLVAAVEDNLRRDDAVGGNGDQFLN
jgi:hypothetical protein